MQLWKVGDEVSVISPRNTKNIGKKFSYRGLSWGENCSLIEKGNFIPLLTEDNNLIPYEEPL